MTRNPWIVLAGFILLCLAVGGIGGYATAQSVNDWYLTLNRPSWNPPNWLFGPVWTALYVAMAVAAWLVWRTGKNVRPALILFIVQLALNLAWSFLFFGARSPLLGLIDIVLLLAAIAVTARAFFHRSAASGLLMLPYLAWVGFATVLNFTIWWLN